MSRKGDRIDRARARLSARAERALSDLCTFTGPGSEERDADGYVTTSDSLVAESIPCSYEALSVFERSAGDEVTQSATHRLKLPANSITLNIGGSARGVIEARGDSPALNFEVTGRLDSSASLFLNLAIVLKG